MAVEVRLVLRSRARLAAGRGRRCFAISRLEGMCKVHTVSGAHGITPVCLRSAGRKMGVRRPGTPRLGGGRNSHRLWCGAPPRFGGWARPDLEGTSSVPPYALAVCGVVSAIFVKRCARLGRFSGGTSLLVILKTVRTGTLEGWAG